MNIRPTSSPIASPAGSPAFPISSRSSSGPTAADRRLDLRLQPRRSPAALGLGAAAERSLSGRLPARSAAAARRRRPGARASGGPRRALRAARGVDRRRQLSGRRAPDVRGRAAQARLAARRRLPGQPASGCSAHYFGDFIRQIQGIIGDPTLSIEILNAQASRWRRWARRCRRTPQHTRTVSRSSSPTRRCSPTCRARSARRPWTARVGVGQRGQPGRGEPRRHRARWCCSGLGALATHRRARVHGAGGAGCRRSGGGAGGVRLGRQPRDEDAALADQAGAAIRSPTAATPTPTRHWRLRPASSASRRST